MSDVRLSDRFLMSQLAYVCESIPYYRQLTCGRRPVLGDLPPIGKEMIRRDAEAFVHPRIRPLARFVRDPAEAMPLFRSGSGEAFLPGGISLEITSGSSGVPFVSIKTGRERAQKALAAWEQRRGIDPSVQTSDLFPLNHRYRSQEAIDPYDLHPENLLRIYERVEQAGARWLHAPPRMLHQHAEALSRHGIALSLPKLAFAECNGMALEPEARESIERYFHVTALSQYGLVEAWHVGLTCRHGLLHVNHRSVHLELLDDSDAPIQEHHRVGRVVLTTLAREMMPFVRYSTGDIAEYVPKTCDCALGPTAIRLAPGRELNLIRGIDPPTFGHAVFKGIVGLTYKDVGLCGITHLQIVQAELDCLKVKTNPIDREVAERFIATFSEKTRYVLGKRFVCQWEAASEDEIRAAVRGKNILFRNCDRPRGVETAISPSAVESAVAATP